jgi:hypothetical protein
MSLSRADKQTQAVVQLLRSLTEKQLLDVLAGVGAKLEGPARRTGPLCTVCNLPYPLHKARWDDDHNFERPGASEPITKLDGAIQRLRDLNAEQRAADA